MITREWLPYRVTEDAVDWAWFGERRLSEPFFMDTLTRRMYLPFNQAFGQRTSLAELKDIAEMDPGIRPSGFIFHMSRCGSTLMSQMLAALADAIVVSESPAFDEVCRLKIDHAEKVEILRSALSVYARPRFGETRYFVKFDCWMTRDLPLIREACPEVPWIFLYREPVEVMVSHMRAPGSQLIPGNMAGLVPELDVQTAIGMGRERYAARVLAEFCSNAISEADDPNGIFVNYDEMPDAVTGRIAEHFKLDLTPAEREVVVAAGGRNAKEPTQAFTPDREQKRAEATDAVRSAADEFLTPLYERLKTL
jgi:hypothetical protein